MEPCEPTPAGNGLEPPISQPTSQPSVPAPQPTEVAVSKPLPCPAPPTASLSSGLNPTFPAAGTSPGALLAASLVRSRATYYERLSSGSRASTSGGSAPGGSGSSTSGGGAGPAAAACPPTPRHSTALAPHPLHPLASHPLCTSTALPRAGSSEELKRDTGDASSDIDMDSEAGDTFFDKPSYTRYGSNVELTAAASYRSATASGGGGSSNKAGSGQTTTRQSGGGGSSNATSCDGSGSERPAVLEGPLSSLSAPPGAAAAAAVAVAPCGSGYVRSVSARFGSMAAGGGSGRGVHGTAGMDGLFDDLVAHMGALLASHPDVEAQMGMVQGLSDRLLELHALCETLGRKEDEVEHLRGVLRELTTTRAEAIRLKVQMAESLNGLQQEYYRVLRSAQMAQGTCKQHSARAAATRKQLQDTQTELTRYKRAVAVLRERNRRLRADNEDMAARLAALEQVRLGGDVRHSACYMALVQAQTAVMY